MSQQRNKSKTKQHFLLCNLHFLPTGIFEVLNRYGA